MTCTATAIINNLIKALLTNTVSFIDIFISYLWLLQYLAADFFLNIFHMGQVQKYKTKRRPVWWYKRNIKSMKTFWNSICNLIPKILWQAIFYNVFIVGIWDALLRKWKRIVILEERSQVSCYAQHWLLVPKV